MKGDTIWGRQGRRGWSRPACHTAEPRGPGLRDRRAGPGAQQNRCRLQGAQWAEGAGRQAALSVPLLSPLNAGFLLEDKEQRDTGETAHLHPFAGPGENDGKAPSASCPLRAWAPACP